MNTDKKPAEERAAEDYVMEQIAPPSSAKLILVSDQLINLSRRILLDVDAPDFLVHSRLCFDAILAIDELLHRRMLDG